ncbi:MAG TPA: DUF3238 domain-containing protein [Cellvibrionaceae bacterium]|nr:DUF3238 domain-containing protein [Cellvibrionaceae bacterium]HMW47003.1 DUF3238 domain-containing protein [Cellvibrionaceae bacterium]
MAKLTFWINSFIPGSVPGYTVTVPKGPHAGKTAVPLPWQAYAWPSNLGKVGKNPHYLTDQRTFSLLPSASSRMRSLIEIETTTMKEITQLHESSGTTEVNLTTGVQTGFAMADMSRCKFATNPAITSYHFYRKLDAAAGDPLVGMAADIDYTGELILTRHGTANSGRIEVVFEGKVDSFPAYECYANFGGVTKLLFQLRPPAGNTVLNLLGAATTPVSGRASF